MAKGYGQYCPLALATELLCQRWTLLVLSRLIDGCRRFNEIQRGVPRMSPTLLSQSLSELQRAGLVEKRPLDGEKGYGYHLTAAGWDLEPIVDGLAVWGQHWARDLVDEDLDPAFLLWSLHTRLDTEAMPEGRTVIEFTFDGSPNEAQQFWIVHEDGIVEMCLKDPELDVDLAVQSELRRFVETWRGFRDLRREIREGHIQLQGAAPYCRGFPAWLRLSGLAGYERRRAGKERDLARSSSTLNRESRTEQQPE